MDAGRAILHKSNMVPAFSLYGEEQPGDLPDVLHCETIAARAALHGWLISPHRHMRMHQVLRLTAHGAMAEVDGARFRLDAPCLVNMPPQVIHGYDFDPGTEGWVLTLPTELVMGRGLARPFVAEGAGDDIALFDLIAAEHAGRAPGRAERLRALAAALLIGITRGGAEDEEDETGHPTLRRFALLIEEHYRKHLPLRAYAEQLGITATHLSRLAREATGAPASRMIEDRIVREARRELAYTALPVSQVAYALGYEDPAYFSRVFSRATGMSPTQFRTRIGHDGPLSTGNGAKR
ncbi:helix-turn-helix domain-containing protein [Pontivivens ytuae]|nr:helix-turn-helix domain-containing protein [Pontivivens ytuae]